VRPVAETGLAAVDGVPSFAQLTPAQLPAVTTAPFCRCSVRLAIPDPVSVSDQVTVTLVVFWKVVPAAGMLNAAVGDVVSTSTDPDVTGLLFPTLSVRVWIQR
jgi:hypothetical protein